eukprot:gene9966-7129_t
MASLMEAINTCSVYKFYGFEGNFCTWEWNWTLQDSESIYFHVFLCLLYLATVAMLQEYVKQSKASHPDNKYVPPFWLESVKYVHNIALSLVSGWMFVTLGYSIIADGRMNSWRDMSCRMTEMKGLYGFANFVFLVSKIWEWADTYWLVLSGKKVIFLHSFHHMTTFTLAAVTHNFPSGGFTLINCLVHTVMYMHYAHPLRWARPFITSGQLLQFVFVMSVHLHAYMQPETCYDMRGLVLEWWYLIVDVFVIFILFGLFFIEEYIEKGNKKTSKKALAANAKKD